MAERAPTDAPLTLPEDPERYPIAPLPGRPKVRTQRWVLLLLILAFFAWLKWEQNTLPAGYNEDGYLYTHIAESVRDGLGLKTRVSLYRKGFTSFPHDTSIYPLWPLTLGYVSRFVPMEQAGRWLPTLFYFLTLILAYVGVRRVWDKSLFPDFWPVLDAGHLMVLMLGTARHFFVHTSLPYTEGMAFFLLFLGIVAAQPLFKSPTFPRALAVGAVAALAMMTRSQMFILYLALVGGLGLATLLARRRAPWLLAALGVTLGFGLALAPWVYHLYGFVPNLGFHHLLRFDAYRETEILRPMQMLVKTDGFLAFLADRAQGIPLAFNGFGRFSYFGNWNLLYQASLLAAPLALWEFFNALRKGKAKAMWAWLREPAHFYALFIALLAFGGFASIHLIHKREFAEWNFGTRHALTTLFVFYICLVYLTRRPVLPRLWVSTLIVLGLYGAIDRIGSFGPESQSGSEDREEEVLKPQLVAWLRDIEGEDPGAVVAAADARRLALHTESMGFHLIDKRTSLRDLQAYSLKLGTDYIVVAQGKTYRFNRNQGLFESAFEKVAGDLDGFDVYRMREGIRITPMFKVPGRQGPPPEGGARPFGGRVGGDRSGIITGPMAPPEGAQPEPGGAAPEGPMEGE